MFPCTFTSAVSLCLSLSRNLESQTTKWPDVPPILLQAIQSRVDAQGAPISSFIIDAEVVAIQRTQSQGSSSGSVHAAVRSSSSDALIAASAISNDASIHDNGKSELDSDHASEGDAMDTSIQPVAASALPSDMDVIRLAWANRATRSDVDGSPSLQQPSSSADPMDLDAVTAATSSLPPGWSDGRDADRKAADSDMLSVTADSSGAHHDTVAAVAAAVGGGSVMQLKERKGFRILPFQTLSTRGRKNVALEDVKVM